MEYDAYFGPIDCDYIWLAAWGPNDGKPHTKPQWCDVWQYTSKGYVNGIGSGCDCDIVYNTDMRLLINQPDPEPEPQQDPHKIIDQIRALLDELEGLI